MTSDEPRPQICLLLALWGKSYIRMFCDISLRSLLADGNIPALAKEYTCSFTLLTQPEDVAYFEAQPMISALKSYCKLRYVDIRDIIYPGNHSATLTVALERGMRSFGQDMLNTYFIFLVADYLFAAHSLASLLPHMRNGVSAVSAGNYQVVEEEVLCHMRDSVDQATGVIAIPNRELVAWSLRHLHPQTVANIVNQSGTHTTSANRLFWQADPHTLIGRFYLRHMLCVKPEITDYVIGASCDYSFLAEMCPSGNVVHLSDSDDYFVVELQPLLHEGGFLAVGHHTPEAVAKSLLEWTTAEQRANAQRPILFHAGEISPGVKAVIDDSAVFIERVASLMTEPPVHVREHFYWRSCILWITANLAYVPANYAEKANDLRQNLWESPVFGPPLVAQGLSMDQFPPMRAEDMPRDMRLMLPFFRCYITLLGKLPDARLWHPHFLDFNLLSRALKSIRGQKTLLILEPRRRQWLEWSHDERFMMRTPFIAYRDREQLRRELQALSHCIIHLPPEYDSICGAVFDALTQAMPPGSLIHIFIKPQMFSSHYFTSCHRALRYGHYSVRPGITLVSRQTYAGHVRRYMDKWLSATASELVNRRANPFAVIMCAIQLALLHLLYAVHNAARLCLPEFQAARDDKSVCSALLTFRVNA